MWIDWHGPAVHIQARVVLRRGALEFLACWPGKEHESILRIEASATDVWMALGLIGLNAGHPPVLDSDTGGYGPPAGDLVDVSVEWEVDGQRRAADAHEWLCAQEYGRAPPPRPWVFAGSLPRADGRLMCEYTGVGFALVDFPDSFFSLSRRFPGRYGSLWAEARAAVIPPTGTGVRLVLQPARPRARQIELSVGGAVYVDGHECSVADAADLIELGRRIEPGVVQVVHVRGAAWVDAARLRWQLQAWGVPSNAVRFVPAKWPPWRRPFTWTATCRPCGARVNA